MEIIDKLFDEKGLEELAEQITKILFKRFHLGSYDYEDLKSEVVLFLLENRQKFKRANSLNFSYLVVATRNYFTDKFLRRKRIVASISLDRSLTEEEETPIEVPDEGEIPPVVLLNIKEAFGLLKENLKESELETLCYYFHSVLYRKDDNPFLADKSQDAKYKAWSRLRPKISKLLLPFEFTEQEMKLLAEILLSECLQKKRLKE